jgi:hypothetical protein
MRRGAVAATCSRSAECLSSSGAGCCFAGQAPARWWAFHEALRASLGIQASGLTFFEEEPNEKGSDQ